MQTYPVHAKFPAEAIDLVAGPILHCVSTYEGVAYFHFPQTGGVFILRSDRFGLVIDCIGKLPEANPATIGIFAYFTPQIGHKFYFYDAIAIYELPINHKGQAPDLSIVTFSH